MASNTIPPRVPLGRATHRAWRQRPAETPVIFVKFSTAAQVCNMTATLPDTPQLPPQLPREAETPAPRPTHATWWRRLIPSRHHRWLQSFLLLIIAGTLAVDRYHLARDYLFKYTDEDQCVMWEAAYELLHGKLREPCFYGQDYNTCLEGFLAAPFAYFGMPYHIACPLVSLLLGLFPFLVVAWVAWRRRQTIVAAISLLIPLILPVRYAMITGMPRGFTTGIAVAMIPAVLLLPPPWRREQNGIPLLAPQRRPTWLRSTLPALRYFFAAALSIIAAQVQPGCVIILVPVALHAILTRWREWKFWAFSMAGLLVALPYPIYVYQFYYVYHPDYVLHLRGAQWRWGYTYYLSYLHQFLTPRFGPSLVLQDLVPFCIPATPASQAGEFLVAAFGIVGLLLLIRLRTAALAAGFMGVFFTFITFGYDRIRVGAGTNSASYSYSRMFLAIPVLFLWLLLFINHTPWRRVTGTALARWAARGTLAGLTIVALYTYHIRAQQQPDAIREEYEAGLRGGVVCPAIPVDQFYACAREIKKIADATHADLLIVGGGDRNKHISYALPAVLGMESLYPDFERRTFRLTEEFARKHDKILSISFPIPGMARAGGGFTVTLDADGNPIPPPSSTAPSRGSANSPSPSGRHVVVVPVIYMFDAKGHSIYDVPELRGRIPGIYVPKATPADPNPEPQVWR
jgi:hypothetical protein